MKRIEGFLITLHVLQVEKGIQELIPFFIHPHYGNVPETKTNTTTSTATATIMASHYEVRTWAGLCIYCLCQKYSKDYRTIQPRVLKTLVDALTSYLQQQIKHQQQQQLQPVTQSNNNPTTSAIQSTLPF